MENQTDDKPKKQELAEERTEKAEDRTDMAADRTMLANERTFAGWARTALACIGVGLGFQAIFDPVEKAWIAKTIATTIIGLGIFIIWLAAIRAAKMNGPSQDEDMRLMKPTNFKAIAIALSVSAIMLIAAIWFLME